MTLDMQYRNGLSLDIGLKVSPHMTFWASNLVVSTAYLQTGQPETNSLLHQVISSIQRHFGSFDGAQMPVSFRSPR
ncbi:hypothetical protein H633G_11330 [Metarhizium anisopliae BRIP 53284]|nr:hypothetical protein H633G_11330 [Metarhizium anisopliae BRIP 53284]